MAKELLKQWIFKTNYECSFVVKPTTVKGIYGNNGEVIQYINIKPIYLKFPNCHCIINQDFADRHDIDLDVLIGMVKKTDGYGKKFWCAVEPEKEIPKEVAKGLVDSKKKAKVIQGVRK